MILLGRIGRACFRLTLEGKRNKNKWMTYMVRLVHECSRQLNTIFWWQTHASYLRYKCNPEYRIKSKNILNTSIQKIYYYNNINGDASSTGKLS
jgi:hypothetical protein